VEWNGSIPVAWNSSIPGMEQFHDSVQLGQKRGVEWFHLLFDWVQKNVVELGSAHLLHTDGEDTSHM
jgi:hypothetical protein